MENFSGQLKKYRVTITDLLEENKKLEARAIAGERGTLKDKLEHAKLKSELHNMQSFVDRIPTDVMEQLRWEQRYAAKDR